MRTQLKWVKDDDYRILPNLHPWGYEKVVNRYFNVIPTLRELMLRVPSYSVFVASGYYDLATPYLGANYTFDTLNLGNKSDQRITMKYYDAGHMMYTNMPSLVTLSNDLRAFIQTTLQNKGN